MKAFLIPAVVVIALTSASFSQTAPDTPPEKEAVKEAVLANDRAFEAAYAKGDVKALAGFFAEDAEYTTEDGEQLVGSASIEESMRQAFNVDKGAKLTITPDTVRVLTPEVVVEKGSTSVTTKDGETSGALYTAIHVKKDGKWKISQLIETPLPEVTPQERLKEISWLIGSWQDVDKSTALTVKSEFKWATGGNFIVRNVDVKNGEEQMLEGWQVIGWDPVEERIRSWTFDSEGGYADAYWTREGNRWLIRESGVNPDGGRTTAENTITKLSDSRFSWESGNRTLNGEPQPSVERIEVMKAKGD
ncbi:SgcJ/EcaC family oxidoreductase [Roseimicrobium sp. ORNL1]|uniref:YybH family protein n=1 Tax=Roseimicrobium sp. ORNL1 TaxID=2711231 RepID=UPI0013E16789|nr:SgcJ/EcaC family oxidoreductase [Roseimicrobium sp. ORNL1]QIF02324.1 SgcJ/EcaC family oxidoreductase [Roseimicrobium sp. ORNL1]